MCESRQLSNDMLRNFIEVYRSFPCLWKIKSAEYSNKILKNQAYQKLIELVQPVFPNADKDFVLRKINSIRGSFRKELKKVMDSKASGAGTEDVYKSSLWYFDLLLFTTDQEIPRKSHDSIQSSCSSENQELLFNENSGQNICDEGSEINETINSPNMGIGNTVPTSSESERINVNQPKKRGKPQNMNDEVITRAYKALAREEDEFDATGFAIAAKLRKINARDETQRLFAEKVINEVLLKAHLGKLTESAYVATETSIQSYYADFGNTE